MFFRNGFRIKGKKKLKKIKSESESRFGKYSLGKNIKLLFKETLF